MSIDAKISKTGACIIENMHPRTNKIYRKYIATGDYGNIKAAVKSSKETGRSLAQMSINDAGDVGLRFFPERLNSFTRKIYSSIAKHYEKLSKKYSGIKVSKNNDSISINMKNSQMQGKGQKIIKKMRALAKHGYNVSEANPAVNPHTKFTNINAQDCFQLMYTGQVTAQVQSYPAKYRFYFDPPTLIKH